MVLEKQASADIEIAHRHEMPQTLSTHTCAATMLAGHRAGAKAPIGVNQEYT